MSPCHYFKTLFNELIVAKVSNKATVLTLESGEACGAVCLHHYARSNSQYL